MGNESERVTWQLTTGQTVEVHTYEYLDQALLSAEVDGVREEGGLTVLPKPQVVAGKTVIARIGRIGLDAGQLASVKALQADLQGQISARPEVQARKLAAERAQLVRWLAAMEEAAYEDSREAIEAAMASGVYKAPNPKAAALAAAIADLAAFDAEHPEVARGLEAAKKAGVNRFLATD